MFAINYLKLFHLFIVNNIVCKMVKFNAAQDILLLVLALLNQPILVLQVVQALIY